jgi:hypothetical protein
MRCGQVTVPLSPVVSGCLSFGELSAVRYGMATDGDIDNWRDLAAKVSVETDPRKLTELIEQLSRALENLPCKLPGKRDKSSLKTLET